MDITYMRKQTTLVIEKDKWYLSRVNALTNRVIWNPHLSESYQTRDIGAARFLANKFQAKIKMFNPIIWEVRDLYDRT